VAGAEPLTAGPHAVDPAGAVQRPPGGGQRLGHWAGEGADAQPAQALDGLGEQSEQHEGRVALGRQEEQAGGQRDQQPLHHPARQPVRVGVLEHAALVEPARPQQGVAQPAAAKAARRALSRGDSRWLLAAKPARVVTGLCSGAAPNTASGPPSGSRT